MSDLPIHDKPIPPLCHSVMGEHFSCRNLWSNLGSSGFEPDPYVTTTPYVSQLVHEPVALTIQVLELGGHVHTIVSVVPIA